MKVLIRISLSAECLRELDTMTGDVTKRSAFIEEAVVEFVARRRRQPRGAKDREIIARHAESLEQDVRETLEFCTPE